MTEARIDIQSMRISARTAPSPTLAPRTPRPSAGTADATFSTPLSTSYEWSATEPSIPAEADSQTPSRLASGHRKWSEERSFVGDAQ